MTNKKRRLQEWQQIIEAQQANDLTISNVKRSGKSPVNLEGSTA